MSAITQQLGSRREIWIDLRRDKAKAILVSDIGNDMSLSPVVQAGDRRRDLLFRTAEADRPFAGPRDTPFINQPVSSYQMSDTATRTRAPRGTKSVSDAFFSALRDIPEARRAEVARAAQIAIRDELKVMRDRAKAAATRAKKSKIAEAPVARKAAAPGRTKPAARKAATKKTVRAKRVMTAEA